MVAFVPDFETFNPFIDLLGDFLARQSATGAEAAIVAKRASPQRDSPVDVGTRETGIDADSLNAMAVQLFQVVSIGKIPQASGSPVHFSRF